MQDAHVIFVVYIVMPWYVIGKVRDKIRVMNLLYVELEKKHACTHFCVIYACACVFVNNLQTSKLPLLNIDVQST